MRVLFYLTFLIGVFVFAACSSTGTSAEEYYSIGMAYFEMGKYEDAERWLNRALGKNKTLRASEYNLGRIAYETGRYTEASKLFKKILKKDPVNVMALKAEAYTQIKLGSLEEADKYYKKVLELEPENADSGYNYALILFAMDKPAESEEVLLKYDFTIDDNKDNLLLLARVQKAQNKLEAIDNYDKWLQKNDDAQVYYEYGLVLEDGGFFAKALSATRSSLEKLTADTATLKRYTVRFALGRQILAADSTDDEGITELTEALKAGFTDKDSLDAIVKDVRLPKTRQDEIRRLIDDTVKKDESDTSEKTDTDKDSGKDSGSNKDNDKESGSGSESESESGTK